MWELRYYYNFIPLGSSIQVLRSSIITPSTSNSHVLSQPETIYVRDNHQMNYITNNDPQEGYFSNLKNGTQFVPSVNSCYQEPQYNCMSKRLPSDQWQNNGHLSKENWNSLYSDVDCVSKMSNSNRTFRDLSSENLIFDENVGHPINSAREIANTAANNPLKQSINNSNNSYAMRSDKTYVGNDVAKAPWPQECEDSDSNVVDITNWIMETLSSSVNLSFLDLAGLESYVNQIVLLIKLITPNNGFKQNNDPSLTASLTALPSASSPGVRTTASRKFMVTSRQSSVASDMNSMVRVKEKRFSDIVGVIKGKKHHHRNSNNNR